MTSGKQARKQRQAAVARPPVRSTEGRRASPKVLAIAVALIIAVALAVVLAIVFTGGSGNSAVTGSTEYSWTERGCSSGPWLMRRIVSGVRSTSAREVTISAT